MRVATIRSDVPLPEPRNSWRFGELKVGESFAVSVKLEGALRNSAGGAGYRLKRKFSVRKQGNIVRCWRVK